MPNVRGVNFYLGKSFAAKHAKPAENLCLEDDGFLCQHFRNSLLESQESRRFHVGVEIPELPPLHVRFWWVGQTAGVAFWIKNEKVGAASILLNGLEEPSEFTEMLALFVSNSLPLPDEVRASISREQRPVVATLFYDLYSMTDPLIATAAPALGAAFFALFGTAED